MRLTFFCSKNPVLCTVLLTFSEISLYIKILQISFLFQIKIRSLFFPGYHWFQNLTLVLLNPDSWTRIYPASANSINPDQLDSESALFVIQFVNLYQQPGPSNLIGWNLEVGINLNLFSMTRVNISVPGENWGLLASSIFVYKFYAMCAADSECIWPLDGWVPYFYWSIETDTLVQTVLTQIRCCRMWHLIRVCIAVSATQKQCLDTSRDF